ncbi:uncharacterized protein CcaverHIS019_0405580 [Cutaneotrichosporon cavernicola]|uniref:Plus3 domain-containing protein n=1 Tax=Cutaneotrichosporon cavernicola TaxID=279322 RepID=A0AA48L4E3_9TREE|nr:uncharacterized protein CcaverHIS019_0405580 [Cutaneotrichosporon cavernicola]BEI91738.1 hypothetical protein CcaverHIS019_0405580 [Cutaneotrichosporon cavernicola]BEI99511.1 hypothetical protein CcaverHIS631_0405540 [Cutaneotrichosporon cavernicola]BEJ07289.1 hypothetical protein CcaverHIS641_0405580 [Cutaneotrichosporon cavernicola]
MSDLENELLGLAEDDSSSHHKKRTAGGRKNHQSYEDSDDNEGEEEMDMDMDEDMEMDVDSEDDATAQSRPVNKSNPYPLEGKYIDEDDRDYLDSLPEIERENILAARQEEIQKFKDAAQLDAMYKMAAGQDEDEDDYTPRKQRKHTSVTDEKYRAMMDLKNKRKSKEERAQRRAAKLAQGGRRARSSSLNSLDDASSEEGEISPRDSWRHASPSRDRPSDSRRKVEVDIDSMPPSYQELNEATLDRYKLVEMMYKDQFEEVIKNAYVRIPAGTDDQGRPKYRVHRIIGVESEHSHGRYTVEYKGRDVSASHALICAYGKANRLYRIADISNTEVSEDEFSRFTMTNKADNVKNPRRSELKAKHEEIVALHDRPMTEDEVNRQVDARKQANPQAQRQKIVLQITSLMSSKQLALRRNDLETAAFIGDQIAKLGADPNTGELLEGEGDLSEYDLRIARINENNRRKTRETMMKAHEAAVAKKKAEDAIVRAKAAAASQEAGQPTIVKEITVKALPIAGMRKGETPQQYVARTVTLDLGDF